jgi:hypothetical protein
LAVIVAPEMPFVIVAVAESSAVILLPSNVPTALRSP